jgi:CheY-like chemotaxis protein
MSATPLKAILVVDDFEDDVHLFLRSAKIVGLTSPIRHVDTVEDAISYVKGEGRFADRDSYPVPALVLLDLKLRGRNGAEVLKWLRSQPELVNIIVVAMTSSENPVIIKQAYQLGANSFVIKPFNADGLNEMVKGLHHYWLVMNRT